MSNVNIKRVVGNTRSGPRLVTLAERNKRFILIGLAQKLYGYYIRNAKWLS